MATLLMLDQLRSNLLRKPLKLFCAGFKKVIFFTALFILSTNLSYSDGLTNQPIFRSDLGLTVNLPVEWHIIPTNDPHLIFADSPDANPNIYSGIFTLQVTAKRDWPSLDSIYKTNAERKAAQLGIKNLISIGPSEKVNIGNLVGEANIYLFAMPEQGMMYEITIFEKDGNAYLLTSWVSQKSGGPLFRSFRQWLEKGIVFQ